MADTLTKTQWDAGAVVATDDIAGIHFPRVKLVHGADGTNAGDVADANPFPTAPPIDVATHIDTTIVTLAVGATYNSPAFDTTVVGKFVTHYIYADVAGTHNYQESHDNATWRTVDGDAVSAGAVFVEEHICNARYHRAQYVNGGTIQATFNHQVVCSFVGVPHEVGFRPGDNIVQGDKTTNTSAPSAEAHEVIGCIANAAAPSYTEGNVVMPRVTLAGDSVVVTATNLDVRDLPSASDSVAAVSAGDVAHDGVDSGNPVSVGGIARSALTSVAALDRVKAIVDLQGRQIVRANAPRGLRIKNTITLTSTTETTLLAAAAAPFHDLTKLWSCNTPATAVRVDFRDTSAGGGRFYVYVPAAPSVGVSGFYYPPEK